MEIIIFLLLCGFISSLIGNKKGETISSFFLGVLLGPIGIIIVLLTKGNRITCPYCRKLINSEATKCPYCQSEISEIDRLRDI